MTLTESSASPSSMEQNPRSDALASLRIERPDPHQPRRSGRKLVWLAVLLLTGGFGYLGYRYTSDPAFGEGAAFLPEIMQQRIEVRLASVTVQQGRSADAVVVASGYLESRRQARIGARAAGRIDAILFEEGDKVEEGDLLAELDHKDMDAALAAAGAQVARAKAALGEQEVAINQAKAEMDRAQKLRKSRSVSDSEYDQARFAYQAAVARNESMESELRLAEAQRNQSEQLRENMFIRAPFDGTVISKDAEEGESIQPGGMGGTSGRGSVATIADLEDLEIECDVQEDFISRIVEGQEADIAIDAVQSKKYHGKVRKIIPMGDRARATIKVKVKIEDADELLFPEMSGTVYFLPNEQDLEVSDEPRMFCPTSSIVRDEQGNHFVWVANSEKRAQKVSVEVGGERDGRTEIIDGLSGKERVVVNPDEVREGSPLVIAE